MPLSAYKASREGRAEQILHLKENNAAEQAKVYV
jgi:hypothetical protein